jgi:7 transmembrane receptor (rhodopsin family)
MDEINSTLFFVNQTVTQRNYLIDNHTASVHNLFVNKTTSQTVSQEAAASSWSNILWSVIQWLIFVLGSFGNLLVVSVLLWRRSREQLVTQLFVGSLSLSGLALMLSSAWVQALLYINSDWKYGKLSCQIQYFLQAEAIYSAIWALATVAIER